MSETQDPGGGRGQGPGRWVAPLLIIGGFAALALVIAPRLMSRSAAVPEPAATATLGPQERYGLSAHEIAGLAPDVLVEKALARSAFETMDAAAAEDPLSAALVCLAHYYGKGVPQDDAKAASACAHAREMGAPLGAYVLSLMTRNGQGGIRADAAQADALLTDAADDGDARAQLALAQQRRTTNPAAARALAERCAVQALADCQFLLARMQLAGEGGPKDVIAARDTFTALNDAVHAGAARELGKLYRDGVGVNQRDVARAIDLFRRAALLDDGEASWCLGRLAEAGDGMTQDRAAAKVFYQDALADGYAAAESDLVRLNSAP